MASSSSHITSPTRSANHDRSTTVRETSDNQSTQRAILSRAQDAHVLPQPVIHNVTDDNDFADQNEFSAWINQQNEDETRRLSATSTRRKSSAVLPRNLPITAPFVSLDHFTHNGIRLSPKVCVELKDGDFMKIAHIVKDTETSEVTIRGSVFRRTREMNGVLDRKLNEVCWIAHIDDDDPRDHKVQGLETVLVTEVVKRRKIRMTNLSFPALSFRDDKHKDTEETVENERVLVCRYKYLCFYSNAKARMLNSWCEKGFHRLHADDCDKRSDNDMKDEDLRSIWRGKTIIGGSQGDWEPGEKEFLRQEAVSHKGIASWQSLKIPGGTNFSPGDPMKRGSVGTLRKEMTPAPEAFSNTTLNQTANNDKNSDDSLLVPSNADDEVEEVGSSPSLSRRTQERHRNRQKIPFTVFDEWLGQTDYDSDGESEFVHALNRSLRKSSIQPQKRRQTSPRIVEFDAQVKTSSKSGIYQKRYEGKITETYIPKPAVFHKRKAEQVFGSSSLPRKQIDRGRGEDPSNRTSAIVREECIVGCLPHSNLTRLRDASPSYSERTLGRSQSEDSVEAMSTPTKVRGYGAAGSGLPTPLSLRRNGSICPTYQCPVRLASPFRTPGPLKPDYGQHCLQEDDDGDFVDLTRPRKILQSTSSSPIARFSMPHQHNTFASLQSRPDLSSSACKMSPSPHVSSRPMPSNEILSSNRDPSSPLAHLSRPSISRGPLPGPHTYLPTYHGPSTARIPQMRSQSTARHLVPPIKQESQRLSKVAQRRYTFGDCFCGAGGMSRGAINAGLRIKWGFDFNLPACQTYALNFFGTPIFNVWANQFSDARGDHKVDICHLSPPCQFFSDAHTWAGKDDEMNTASLFAIFNLLEKAKPRVVTLEQTSGLIRRHPIYFNAVVNMFTSRGFSVRWRVMNCADFGLPQRRMRLFVIASW